jgi:hypothetical protein
MKTTLSVAVGWHATKALWRCVCQGRSLIGLWRAVTLAFGTALALRVVLGAVPADATTLPVVAPGDPISGLLAIDPTTPPDPLHLLMSNAGLIRGIWR